MLVDDIVKNILGKNIRLTRISQGLTQEILAENSNISVSFLKDIESGKTGIRIPTLLNISNSLNVTPNELLKDYFLESFNNNMDLVQQINLLNEYEKNSVIALINYFASHQNN